MGSGFNLAAWQLTRHNGGYAVGGPTLRNPSPAGGDFINGNIDTTLHVVTRLRAAADTLDFKMTELRTERLVLRPFTLDDAQAYWPLVSDPAILKYTGESALQSLDEVREVLITRPLRDYAVHGYGRLACIEIASGELVGFCGLKYLDDLAETDVGYRFIPRCWGMGYATESAHAVMQHGRDQLGLSRIIGLVEPDNQGSIRVLEKLGLTLETRIRLSDHPDELLLYA